eukprot:40902_1
MTLGFTTQITFDIVLLYILAAKLFNSLATIHHQHQPAMSVNPSHLKDLQTMYESLQNKLSSSTNTRDLIPFLHQLCNHSDLKQMLSTLLHQQYLHERESPNNII